MRDKKLLKPGDLVNKRFRIVSEIGEGGFGIVYEVFDKDDKESYAMKVELKKPDPDEPGLTLEMCVLRRLQNSIHVVRYIDSGELGPSKLGFLIMQLVGRNLAELRRSCPNMYFSMATGLRVGLQCLEAIEDVHSSSLLHRDIKPANFAIGRQVEDYGTIFILDFGLVRRFRLKSGMIRQKRPRAAFRGTVKYASINIHKNIDAGRVDDLWSWWYMLIELLKGSLPWRKAPSRAEVFRIKMSSRETLVSKLPKEFDEMYSALMKMEYADVPLYYWFRGLINQVIRRRKLDIKDPFDWEAGGRAFEETKKICAQPYSKQLRSMRKVVLEKLDSTTEEDDKDTSHNSGTNH